MGLERFIGAEARDARMEWNRGNPLECCNVFELLVAVEPPSWVTSDKLGDLPCTFSRIHNSTKLLWRIAACVVSSKWKVPRKFQCCTAKGIMKKWDKFMR